MAVADKCSFNLENLLDVDIVPALMDLSKVYFLDQQMPPLTERKMKSAILAYRI